MDSRTSSGTISGEKVTFAPEKVRLRSIGESRNYATKVNSRKFLSKFIRWALRTFENANIRLGK
jgi:hypothetical protein